MHLVAYLHRWTKMMHGHTHMKTVKVLKTFLGAILWKNLQLFRRILNDDSNITRAQSLQCWFHETEQAKPAGVRSGEHGECYAPVLSHCVLLRNPWPNRPVCWRTVVKEKPTVRSPFFGAFPTDCIGKATKDVNVNIFLRSRNSCKLYKRIPVNYSI